MEAHQSIIEKKSKVDLSSHQGFNKPFEPQLKISAAKNDSKEKSSKNEINFRNKRNYFIDEKDYNPNDSKENLEIINSKFFFLFISYLIFRIVKRNREGDEALCRS